MANKYITTTLPYVNSEPHIGAAYEFLMADTLARYWRLQGDEVFFNTGTDEHGQKVSRKADEEGRDRQEYVDHFAGQFAKLKEALNLSYDNFIRTTDEKHKAAAQEMWKRCEAKGDIYKKKYTGLYCVGCEAFKIDTDLVDGKCPDHDKAPEEVEEENYFFKLSNYQEYLLEYLEREGSIVPDFRRQEAINFVTGGLEDLSISREKSRMDWGVSVPGDDEHVMYVWFDALTNYISTLGWPEESGDFTKFWKEGEVLQVAGKDQVRFQSVIWQAMLKSADMKATDTVVYHGFINSGGQKMSKSLGNVISPYELIEKYGTEATRYLLLRHVHPFDDTDVTWERLDEWYEAGLVNGLGNLVSRVMNMSEKNEVKTILPEFSYPESVTNAVGTFEFHEAFNYIWSRIQRVDEKITKEEPFKVVKSDTVLGKTMIQSYVQEIYLIALSLVPFMPETSEKILEAIKANKKPENLFNRLET